MILNNCIRYARSIASALFLAIAMSLSVVSVFAQSATFSGRDYPIVGNTHIAADFNGDGKIDLAGAGLNARVMLGLGDGSFRTQVEYPAGGYTQDLAAGELNSALASVLASVTIAPGASSANFTITTTSVASTASVTISATLNTTMRTATLTLNPAPVAADTVSITLAQYETSKPLYASRRQARARTPRCKSLLPQAVN